MSPYTFLFPSQPELATSDHPHFVGIAQLRSLLTHEAVAGDGNRTDAVLDMISLLLKGGAARCAVQTFCMLRESCEPVCYLALFRLRRWLEQHVQVRVDAGTWTPLNLAFRDYKKLVQHYRREAWEWQDTATALQDMTVRFAWSREQVLADVPVAASAAE